MGAIWTFLAGKVVQIIILAVIGYFGKKIAEYVKQHQFAQTLLIIADDITDEILALNPGSSLAQLFDKAVDKLREVTGVKEEIARRVITAAFVRAKANKMTEIAKTVNIRG